MIIRIALAIAAAVAALSPAPAEARHHRQQRVAAVVLQQSHCPVRVAPIVQRQCAYTAAYSAPLPVAALIQPQMAAFYGFAAPQQQQQAYFPAPQLQQVAYVPEPVYAPPQLQLAQVSGYSSAASLAVSAGYAQPVRGADVAVLAVSGRARALKPFPLRPRKNAAFNQGVAAGLNAGPGVGALFSPY